MIPYTCELIWQWLGKASTLKEISKSRFEFVCTEVNANKSELKRELESSM